MGQCLNTKSPIIGSFRGILRQRWRRLGIAALLALNSGCSNIIQSATTQLAQSLSAAITEQSDLETVRQGAPAYLLLIDGMIRDDPENVPLLLMGAKLYGTYATAFVSDAPRAKLMNNRAHGYATQAFCQQNASFCPRLSRPYQEFAEGLTSLSLGDVPSLYGWAAALAGRIQANSEDFSAIADLPKVEAAMRRVIELNENHDNGGAHLYLGVTNSLRPPALGGKPEVAKSHFERAMKIAGPSHLFIKVLYAKHYARLVFDRELHDKLLREVIAAKAESPGYTLANTLAQSEARKLLASGADYF